MITYESQRGRRIIARLERNEALIESIERIARDHTVTTGFVEAVGVLTELTVRSYDAGTRARGNSRRIVGPVELLSAKGTLASTEGVLRLDMHVLVSKETELGPVVVGGHLAEGEAVSVDVVIHAFDDLGVRRERDERSGLVVMIGQPARDGGRHAEPARREPAREPDRRGVVTSQSSPGLPALPTPSGWAAAAAASASAASATGRTTLSSTSVASLDVDDPLGAPSRKVEQVEYEPAVGEYIDHRQFGLCRVDKVGPDGELMIRLETGRRKEIRIDIFEVSPPRMEGSRKVYTLKPRR